MLRLSYYGITLLLILLSSVLNAQADNNNSPFPLIGIFGTFGNGDGELQHPCGLAVDEENQWIYIADTGNNKIKKFNRFGDFQDSFGGVGTEDGKFIHPYGVAVDTTNDDIYVVDTVNHRIQKFHIAQGTYTFILKFGEMGSGNTQFYLPRDMDVGHDGNIYVCDSGNQRIQKFNTSGDWLNSIGQDAGLLYPYGLDVDANGNIYVADTYHHRIVKFNSNGNFLMEFGTHGTGPGEFYFPRDVGVDSSGNIFVADTENYRIQKFDSNGKYLNSFGVFVDFLSPQKVVIDKNYKLYVIDSNTNKLRIYDVSNYISNVFAEPNPFSPDNDTFLDTTYIHYTIPEPAKITITIYDNTSSLVRTLLENEERFTSSNAEEWDGKDDYGITVFEGIYTCKIDAVNAVNYHAPQVSCEVMVYYPKGQISGTVTDGINPIEGAVVTDGIRYNITDKDGNYTIKNVPAGVFTVIASKSGYSSAGQQVIVGIEEIVTGINFILVPISAAGQMSGKVTDDKMNPIEGAIVSDGDRHDISNADGEYTIKNIPDGTYTVTASKEGFKPASQSVTITDGGIVVGVDFMLESEVNHPPVLDPIGNKEVDEGKLLEFIVTATDEDDDILIFEVENLPTGSTVIDAKFSWRPAYDQAGTYTVTFNVYDGKGGTDTETIIIIVNNITPPRYVWMYEFEKFDNEEVINYLYNMEINGVFLSLDVRKINEGNPNYSATYTAKLQDFINQANTEGIEVHAMTLEAPNFTYESEHQNGIDLVEDVIAYCRNNPLLALKGVHIDTEPHVLDEWQNGDWNRREILMQSYVLLLSKIRDTLDANSDVSLHFSAAIAWWYNEKANEGKLPSGDTLNLAKYLQTVVPMVYVSPDGIISRVEDEIEEADTIVGIKVEDFFNFYKELKDTMVKIDKEFESKTHYKGISVFEYKTMKELYLLPTITILTDKPEYYTNDTLTITAYVTNRGNDVNVDVKIWLKLPTDKLISLINMYNYTLKQGIDFEVDIFYHTFVGSEPPGVYLGGSRFLNLITGAITSEDFTFFEFLGSSY
ncbi:MAG: carboxypeptidase regulatory-like domain-containing protein [bacterium]